MGADEEEEVEGKAMSEDRKATERRRRELAQHHAGKVTSGSGRAIEPRRLDQMVSLRLEPGVIVRLRQIAKAEGATTSDLLRRGAFMVISETERANAPVIKLRVIDGGGMQQVVGGSTTSNRAPSFDTRPITA